MMYRDYPMENPFLGGMQENPHLGGIQENPFMGVTQQKCPCIPQETVITNVRLARAYVPFQKLCTLYSPDEALHKGTVFPELYSPYFKEKDMKISPLMEKCGDYDE